MQQHSWNYVSLNIVLLTLGFAVGCNTKPNDDSPADPETKVSGKANSELAGDANELVDNAKLRNAYVESRKNLMGDAAEQIAEARRQFHPGFLLVPREHSQRLNAGAAIESSAEHLDLLKRGLVEVCNLESYGSVEPQKDPLKMELAVHNLALRWRKSVLDNLKRPAGRSPEKWELFRQIENTVFGPLSVFEVATPEMRDAVATYQHLSSIVQAIGNASGIKNGELSWRVAALPSLQQHKLYGEFSLDSSWQAPPNSDLLAQMPEVFETPANNKVGFTTIREIVGEDTIFRADKAIDPVFVMDDGSYVGMIMVVGVEKSQEWIRPGGLAIDPGIPLQEQLGTPPIPAGYLVGLASMATRIIPPDADPALVHQFFNKSDGLPSREVVDENFPIVSAETFVGSGACTELVFVAIQRELNLENEKR